ncbi:phage/plasmid primase, P4 family [Clostridium sp.]|uniref:DNA primase family protein n=1 Tax=Clostridium sp. TaxID=1506 RepID=UPI002FCB3868
MDFNAIKRRFKVTKDYGHKCRAHCPAHNDNVSSLSLEYKIDKNKTLIKCHGGCTTEEVLRAAGLTFRDLYAVNRKINRNEPERVYKYRNEEGKVDLLGFNFSEVGNAKRLLALHGKNLRYQALTKRWYLWGGTHWEVDETLKIELLAKDVLERLQKAASGIDTREESGSKFKQRVMNFIMASESDNKIKSMINQCKNEEEIAVTKMDQEIYKINTVNGTVNLKEGTVEAHNREDLITKVLPFNYNKEATCENWLKFLDKIFLGDKGLIDFIQKSIGYSLTGDTSQQCYYICHGRGANGKSTFLNTIREIMGEYSEVLNELSIAYSEFATRGPREDIAKLASRRFVVVPELNEGRVLDDALLKSLTGENAYAVRHNYGREFQLRPEFKLWISSNEIPEIKSTSEGTWRRIRLIPFFYKFSEEERDEYFYEKHLKPELEGIFAWAIEGCLKWQSEGIKIPEKVILASKEYKEGMDLIGRFIDECCTLNESAETAAGVLYSAYVSWCKNVGEEQISQMKFSLKLAGKGFKKNKRTHANTFSGIELK